MKPEKIYPNGFESNISHQAILSSNILKNEKTSFRNPHGQNKEKWGFGFFRRAASFIHSLDSVRYKIWKLLIKPRSKDEDKNRREFILNVILCSFLVFLCALSLVLLYKSMGQSVSYRINSLIYISGIFTPFVSLLYLSRCGYLKTASYGLIGLITLFSSLGALEWGFDLPAVIITYLLVIVISSILINKHFGLTITIFLCFLMLAIGYYQIEINSPDVYWRNEDPELIDIVTYSVELLFIMSISWLYNHLIEKSLIIAKTSEERLKFELERIEKVYHFAEFGKLSSGAFHDLMSPLTAISLSIEELNELPHIQDLHIQQTQKSVESAIKASKRMHGFIEALEKQIKPSEMLSLYSVNSEIEQAMEFLSFKTRRSKCEIQLHTNKNITTYGNSLTLYQTLTNLISNSVDSYELITRKHKPIKIILTEDQETISIRIKDKGIGIKQELLPKIFDPFFTTKDPHKGMGLGLSISKERVEKECGGTLTVVSREYHGTTFTISLPKRNAPKTD